MMWQSGMHGLDDIGSQPLCEQGQGVYTNLMLNITRLPAGLISGLCLPAECSQMTIDSFAKTATSTVNNILDGFIEKLGKIPSGDKFI
jgi:hypothetical protein